MSLLKLTQSHQFAVQQAAEAANKIEEHKADLKQFCETAQRCASAVLPPIEITDALRDVCQGAPEMEALLDEIEKRQLRTNELESTLTQVVGKFAEEADVDVCVPFNGDAQSVNEVA